MDAPIETLPAGCCVLHETRFMASISAMHFLRSPKYRRRAGLIIANSFNSLLVPVFGIVVSLLVVRLTSVELWGTFVEVMIWAQLAAMVVGWGNKEFLLRAFSRQPAQMAVRWQSSLVTRSALLLPAGLGLALLGWPGARWPLALVWLLALVIAQSHEAPVVYRRRFVPAAAVELAATALTVGGVLTSRAGLGVDVLVAIFVLAAVGRALALSLLFRNDVWSGFSLRPATLARLWQPAYLRLSFFFFALGLTGMLQSRADLYSVNYFLSPSQVGAYQIFSSFLLTIQSLSAFVLTPFLKGVFRLGYEAIARVAARLFGFGLIIIGPALLLIYIILTFLYHLLLPASFYVLGAFSVLPIFYFLPTIYALYKAERQHLVLAVNLCGLTAKLALNILLLPRLGSLGAILSATLVHWGVLCIYLFLGRKLRAADAALVS